MHITSWFFLLYLSTYTRAVEFNDYDKLYSEASQRSSQHHTCGTSRSHRRKRHDLAIFPRRPPGGSKYGYALQFESRQVIQYLKRRSPSKALTIDFWMKPEGGQHNPTVVLQAYDKCAPENEARGWFIGLREASVSSDIRITFTVHSASSSQNKTIMSHKKLDIGYWVHVAATYDGARMKLYVNQAKVAVGFGQKGPIFDSITQGQACDLLELGGDMRRGFYYRGQIDKLTLWSEAITHSEITQSWSDNTVDGMREKIFLYDDFDGNDIHNRKWIPRTVTYPRFVRSSVPDDKHDLSIRKPPCGMTTCDNPEVIRSYVKHPDLRGVKLLKLRIINVMNNDGTQPMVTDDAIRSQIQQLDDIFRRYNISWQPKVIDVRNSSLRRKVVLYNCQTAQIGDGVCNEHCKYNITGMDGGDCMKRTDCAPEVLGNKICNPECNKGWYSWDNGDCCQSSSSKTCYDPKSSNKGYLSLNEFKKAIGLDNKDALNVYVVNWSDRMLKGAAIFPWDKEAHTDLGGVVVPPHHFGKSKILIHEIGHALGLWHVHHGISEMECSSDCIESFPSLELGDLCSDTNPTIVNSKCSDPDPSENTCGLPPYKNTPYRNFMGYANDKCTNHFTPQQVARMHCYIDLDFQSWQIDAPPSFVPLPPRITSVDNDKIQLNWIPPFGSGGNNAKNLCNECQENQVLEQYATTAYSPMETRHNGDQHAPHQATGLPDAQHCSPAPGSWRAQDLECKNCLLYLEVGFKQAVVPTKITIWVSYGSKNAFSDIMMVYVDGSTQSIGNGTAQCDTPFTKPLYSIKKKVSKVRIYVSHNNVCIDAVKLTSGVGHPNCSKCKSLHYFVRREPPFPTGHEERVASTRFQDKNIDEHGRYEYRVRAVTHDDISGPFSPPLIYEPRQGFCGDGKVDKGETCDDGNVRDGDGCNVQCHMEDVFNCNGLPSLCYRHDGDGICEEFERQTSIKDCGFYTPEGSIDQWVHDASPNPELTYTCPLKTIIGPPRVNLTCSFNDASRGGSLEECNNGWSPLNKNELETGLWIKVAFKRPAVASAVVLYLASVWKEYYGKPVLIKFELTGSGMHEKTTMEHRLTKNCKENPVSIPVLHDMTKPFFKTRYIKVTLNLNVEIAAIALRSPKRFDPVALQNCKGPQLFHPSTQQCGRYECNMPKCSKLILKYAVQKRKCKKGSEEGETCEIQCEKGFKPVKPFEVMCSGGKWTVDGVPPRCTPVDCGTPQIQNAEIYCPDGTSFGKKCLYKCKNGAKHSGAGTEPSVTCEADGLWSAMSVFCRKTCALPITPPNSMLISKNCNKGKPFIAGDFCKYRCKSGYKASGLNQKGNFVRTCLKDGSWSGKRCIPETCPVVDTKLFRWYNCTKGNEFGSVCKLTCPNNKVRIVKCEVEGKWDEKFQWCSTKGSCSPPVNLGKELTHRCGKHVKPGDECVITCPEGYTPAIKRDSKRSFNALTCSPWFNWFPDPSMLTCLIKCKPDMIGDDYCNEENNNSDCEWDGGDCCNPNAIKSEAFCGDNCACLDPRDTRLGSSGDDAPSN